MAVTTRHSNVAVCQDEARLLVSHQRERGRLITLKIVTALAAVEVWGRCKLSGVPVGMAVRTALKLDLEQRVFSFWDMTLRTLEFRVSTFKGISRC